MEKVQISDITISERHRRDLGDLQSLADSIRTVGLLQPIVVNSTGLLICGYRRLLACRDFLAWRDIRAWVFDGCPADLGEWFENENRKDLDDFEKVSLIEDLRTQKGAGRPTSNSRDPDDFNAEIVTTEAAAETVGMSRHDYFLTAKLLRECVPEVIDLVKKGELAKDAARMIGDQPEERQREIVALPARARGEEVRRLREEPPPTDVKRRRQRDPSPKQLEQQVTQEISRCRERVGSARKAMAADGWPKNGTSRDEAQRAIAELQAFVAAIDAAPDPKPKRRQRKRGPKEEPRCRPRLSEEDLNRHWAGLTDAQRAKAECQAKVAADAEEAHKGGVPRREACDLVAKGTAWHPGTVYQWLLGRSQAGLVDYPMHLWPLVMAPRHVGGTAEAECHPAAFEAFKADFLRPEKPPLALCYRNLQRVAEREGWPIPRSPQALKDRLEREVHPNVIVLAREGAEALSKRRPPQIRERPERAMQAVNADGHKMDVFVLWPGAAKPVRPTLVAWQDIHSGKILSWRIDRTENADGYRLAFADLLRDYGIPEHIFVDNGRGIAAKELTGGKDNRYRFKVKRDDPVGLLTQLIGENNIHWCTPYHGQSKPIERSFRDLAQDVAKDHRLRGAYTGSDPTRKPANYDEKKGVELEKFKAVLQEGIARHNARQGRRGLGLDGRSFDDAFQESYDAAAVARPTEAQLTRWLLGAEKIRAHKDSGAVVLFETRYWSEKLCEKLAGRSAGQRDVVVRFDPDNFNLPLIVEFPDGRLIAKAEPQGAVKFIDTRAARDHARDQRRLKKNAREQLKLYKSMSDREYEHLLDEADEETREAEAPPARSKVKVVAGSFGREQERKQPAPRSAMATASDDLIRKMAARKFGPIAGEDEELPAEAAVAGAGAGNSDFLMQMTDRFIPPIEGDE